MRQLIKDKTLTARCLVCESAAALWYLFPVRIKHTAFRPPAVIVLLLATASVCLGNPLLPGYLPDPTASNGELMDGVWVFQSRTVVIRMTPMTDASRSAYIEEKTGSSVDPFGPRPDGSVRFVSFLLEILNRSDGPLAFEPQKCWLLAPPGELKLPVDLARIQTGYSVHEQDMPEAFTVAAQALFNGEQHLTPGHKVTGLLVFSAPRDSPREFRVELPIVDSRGQTFEYKAAYATEKRLNKKLKKLQRQRERGTR